MVTTTPADSKPSALEPPAAHAPVPRARLRNVLVALCVLGVPLAWSRDPQLVWQPLLPIPLLFLTPRGASRVLVAFAAVILLIGSGVTTYRVGMAVPDWPATFAQNMWTYPFADMIAEGRGVTLEHVHRLWGTAVGLVAICVVLSCHIHRARLGLTVMAWATLVAVSIQGLVGGTRVLADSQDLAFLHGVLAQAVVATIVALAVVASASWEKTTATPSKYARSLHALGPIVAVAVYLQIALGAWLRHHGETAALLVHGTLALLVVAFVFAFAKVLKDAADEGALQGVERRSLTAVHRWQLGAVATQFALGVLVTVAVYFISGGMDAPVSVGEVAFAAAHVLVGAVVLSSTVVGAMLARRALRPLEVPA